MRNGFEVTSIHASNGFQRPLASEHPSGPAIAGPALFPCSPPQQWFWFEENVNPGSPALNVAFRCRLLGEISTEILEQAWNVLLARHGALRTSLQIVDGEVMQHVAPHASLLIPVVDLLGMPEADAYAEADRLASLEARTPFDVSRAPLIRVTRMNVRDGDTTLLITAHHAISDGWSIGILAREMGELCAAYQSGRLAKLPALRASYGEYATDRQAWLRTESLEAEMELLRAALAEYKPFEVTTDRLRPTVLSGTGSIVSRLIDESTSAGLAALARAHGSTLFTAALSGLFALLHRYTGEADIWISSQVSGRDEVELENLVGCFINTIALHGNVAGDPTYLELLERTRETAMDALETRNVPIDRIGDIVRSKTELGRGRLFSVNFVFQRSFIGRHDFGTFVLDGVPASSAGSLYDLNFYMVERPEGWRASLEYDTDLFEERTIAALLDHFTTMLASIVAEPGRRVSELPMLDAATEHALTVESNRTAAAYPDALTMPQLFEAQVDRTPGATALVCERESLSYAELDAASNRLARELQTRGISNGTRVGVFLERSADLVIALLAILKAGAAYVPLDPVYPAERIDYIAQHSTLATIVTRSTLEETMGTTGVPLLLLDTDADTIAACASDRLAPGATPDDLAYVIYTSGSTGMPKGVEIQHRALVNFLWAMRDRPGLDARDTLVAVTTISFDIAALELYLPLVVGAKLVLATNADVGDGASLLKLLQRSHATALQATPVTWQLLLEAGWRGDPMLKMLCGGEALSRELAARLLAACAGGLWNMYGPTETTIWSSALRVESADGPIPIGPPIANTQFYVLGTHGELMPPGVPGELCIGGDGVARGYLGRDDLTQQRFVADRFRNAAGAKIYRTGDLVRRLPNGNFEFLGRTDHQVKLRGYRIELGEIESALLRQPGVAAAVAVIGQDAAGEKALWAYVVPASDVPEPHGAWAAGLRAHIGSFLPAYMVPSPIVALPALPRTPNGKIDRRALPAVQTAPRIESGDTTPQTDIEARLAATISKLLGYEAVGRNANIFDLGFHSLLAVRLAMRIAEEFDVKVPVRALFDHPTVAELAHRIDVAPGLEDAAGGPVVTLNSEGTRTPFIYLHSDLYADGVYCRTLAAAVGPARPFHSIAPHGTHDLELLPTIEAMARDYYPRILALQPQGPYRLGGFCASALVAYELARLLRENGHAVEDVILINAATMPARAIPLVDWILRKISLDARLPTQLREQFCYKTAMIHEALALGPAGVARLVRGRLRKWLTRTAPEPAETMAPSPFVMQRGSRETENSFAHLAAAFTYHPKPYDGRITLVWAMGQTSDIDDLTVGWERLARDVRVVKMTGGHVSPLHERIHELAAILAGLANEESEA